MKKLFVIMLAAALLLCACGKTAGNTSGADPVSSAASQTESAAETKVSVFEPIKGKIAEPELRRLFDGNLDCMLNIFELSELPHEKTPVSGTLYYVTERFTAYSELEAYVNAIYCADAAKEMLGYEVNGHVRYVDHEGKLCFDSYCATGKGYYVDWEDYKLTVELLDDSDCYFTVSAFVEYPADEPKKEPYAVLAHAVCENGVWKLEQTYY